MREVNRNFSNVPPLFTYRPLSTRSLQVVSFHEADNDLSRPPWLICHGRRTLGVIRQNIVFALSVKLLFMGLALANIATLWMVIAADIGASLLVVMNTLRLLNGRQI